MKPISISIILIAFLLFSIPCTYAETILPGAWEYIIETTAIDTITGERVRVAESKMLACLTEEKLKRPPLNKDKLEQKGAKCSKPSRKEANGIEEWKMSCVMPEGVKLKVTSTMESTAKYMKMKMVTSTEGKGNPTQLIMSTNATYKGECTKDMPVF